MTSEAKNSHGPNDGCFRCSSVRGQRSVVRGSAAMNAFDLDTPSLYVDLDVLERNIRSMQARCREMKVGLRPHTKTHKIPEIARMQLAAGAVGLTVAKTGEAEVMPGDVLIGYPLTAEKLPRVQAM